ncbi:MULTISPECIES: putative DNA modification/repair radical SAM protein [unclassified Acidisoma]|uniref:putative DNA modification/repair radical SAM protein n=1 Tax=unclassified Acidisoma TaxID=2634065 RepID=UPI00131C4D42|nr:MULTISPECIES: putative DNA modification/repair radical SAM protein [unclassified Acidisoma]
MQTVLDKLAILADAAKYDASCASSGAAARNSLATKAIGSTEGMGICHAYAPDGRCISLLKILLTNYCQFDCHYCVNRVSSNVKRARFSVEEVVDLTLGFYKRNYIEGLFLSSGIIQSPDYTMEQVVRVAETLRHTHSFGGYIHLKTIPDADPALLARAGAVADRLSINVELPQEASLARLAPQKSPERIRRAMGTIRLKIEESKEAIKESRKAPRFSTGQSTQMIVGADRADDLAILDTSRNLYGNYKLSRVYYSAFSPIPDASSMLPLIRPPLMREHRLYQADWLMRFYGFSVEEIATGSAGGMLDLAIDPKLAWALQHRDWFPVDVNRASREMLLRVPGFGTKSVKQMLSSRRWRRLRLEDIARLCRGVKSSMPFITAEDWQPGGATDRLDLRKMLSPPCHQGELFA